MGPIVPKLREAQGSVRRQLSGTAAGRLDDAPPEPGMLRVLARLPDMRAVEVAPTTIAATVDGVAPADELSDPPPAAPTVAAEIMAGASAPIEATAPIEPTAPDGTTIDATVADRSPNSLPRYWRARAVAPVVGGLLAIAAIVLIVARRQSVDESPPDGRPTPSDAHDASAVTGDPGAAPQFPEGATGERGTGVWRELNLRQPSGPSNVPSDSTAHYDSHPTTGEHGAAATPTHPGAHGPGTGVAAQQPGWQPSWVSSGDTVAPSQGGPTARASPPGDDARCGIARLSGSISKPNLQAQNDRTRQGIH